MLCRLTPPLCLNFLGLMHLDSHIIADTGIVETSYTKVLSCLDLFKAVVADYFDYCLTGLHSRTTADLVW